MSSTYPTYRNSFVTHLGPGAVEDRERDVQRHEDQGLQFRAHFRPRQQNFAAVLISLYLLAVAVHTVCDVADGLGRAARGAPGPRCNFFGELSAITVYLIFAAWKDLLLTLAFAKPPPVPP